MKKDIPQNCGHDVKYKGCAYILVFKAAPPTPPSAAKAAASENKDENYLSSMKNLLTNKSYVLLLITYGMNVGVFYAISPLLNPMVLHYYPVSII